MGVPYKDLKNRTEAVRRFRKRRKAKEAYYAKIYRFTVSEENNFVDALTECLKLGFETDRIVEEYEANQKSGLKPLNLKNVKNLRIVFSGKAVMPKIVLVKEAEKKLLPFFLKVAEDFARQYSDSVSLDIVKQKIRRFQEFNLHELITERDLLRSQKNEMIVYRVFQERDKAEKVLSNAFGHGDLSTQLRNLREKYPGFADRERLWRECMLLLHSKGYGFYESFLACNRFVFPHGSLFSPFTMDTEVREFISPFGDAVLVAWREAEKEDYLMFRKCVEDYTRGEAETRRREAVFVKELREWLINFIVEGGSKNELHQKCIANGYPQDKRVLAINLYDVLRREGYQSKRFILEGKKQKWRVKLK